MRVNKGVGDACLVQDQMQVLDVVASRAEHDRLLPSRNDFLEQVEKRGNLALLPAVEERHPQRLRDLGVDIEPAVLNRSKFPKSSKKVHKVPQKASASKKNLFKHFDLTNLSFAIST